MNSRNLPKMTKLSQQTKVLNLLKNNSSGCYMNELSIRLNSRSITQIISKLRAKGECIFTLKTSKGTKYTLGRPTKAMIIAAYKKVGFRAFRK